MLGVAKYFSIEKIRFQFFPEETIDEKCGEAPLKIRRDWNLLTSKRLSSFIADSCAHSHPAIPHGTLHSFTHAIDLAFFPAAVTRCTFESGSNFLAQHLNAWQKCAALRGNKGDRSTWRKKGDTIGRRCRASEKEKVEERERERKKERRTTRERFYRSLMPFHPLPLFCTRNTKNLTFPSSAFPLILPLLALPANSSIFPLVLYVLFPFSASRAIFPRSERRRSLWQVSYNWNLRTTGTDRYRLFGRDKSYFFPSADPNLYSPFVFSLPARIRSTLFFPRPWDTRALTYHTNAMNMFLSARKGYRIAFGTTTLSFSSFFWNREGNLYNDSNCIGNSLRNVKLQINFHRLANDITDMTLHNRRNIDDTLARINLYIRICLYYV